MKDRIPLYPGRVTLTPVSGQANTYDMTRADQPTEEGTPLNKGTLLKDATAALYGLGSDAVPDEVLGMLKGSLKVEESSVPDKQYGIDYTYNSFDTDTSGSGSSYRKIVEGNGLIVSIQEAKSSVQLSRDSGVTWETVNLSDYLTFVYGLAFGNGRFVFTGLNGKWASTADFNSWKTGQFDSTDIYLVEFGNGIFVAMNDIASKKMFSTSTDGTAWTNRTHNLSVASYQFSTSAFLNGIFLFVMDGSAHALKSTNGLNWTYESTPTSSGMLIGTIANYFVLHNYNSYSTYLSDDGSEWQNILTGMLYPAYEDESKLYFFKYGNDSPTGVATFVSVNKNNITTGNNLDLPSMTGWSYSGDWRCFLRGQSIISGNKCINVAWNRANSPGVFITENTTKAVYTLQTPTGTNVTDEVAQALGSVKVETGSYTGTGTYGSSNPNTLTFDGPPFVVYIRANDMSAAFVYLMYVKGLSDQSRYSYTNGDLVDLTTTLNGNTLSYYTNDSYKQNNASGIEYVYFAITAGGES